MRLKTRRLRLGLTQEQLAQSSGASPGSIANWESEVGNIPSPAKLKKLASVLGVTIEWLLSKDEPATTPTPKNHGGPFWGLSDEAPVVSWASAGDAHAYEDQGHDVERIKTDCKDPNCYALRIEGDSMEPVYRHGDYLVLAPNLQAITGDLVVLKTMEDSAYCKILQRSGPSAPKLTLVSYNPVYPPIDLHASEVRFIHVVHSVLRKLKR